MMATARENDLLEDEYNRYPYESFPFAQSHPVHLHSLATLFGMKPTPVEKARILELGGASGGNILPLAFQYPQATFLGIDLSDKEIQEGIQHIQALNLKNITLRHQSILDFDTSDGKFDYIICHGVYSWVDNEVRKKIFKICEESLSPNGIAYISYNTYPGWNMVNSLRDLMLWHTEKITDPVEKARHARLIGKFITDGLQNDHAPYSEFLKNEIKLITNQADSYLLHDHLSTFNEPVYFYQFMDQAHASNLSYLSDAYPSLMFADNLPPIFADELKKIKNIIIAGQYMDFIRNQRFRCTLLCQKDTAINRSLQTNDIEKFYLSFTGKSQKPDLNQNDIGKELELTFTNGASMLKVRNVLSQWAMYILYLNSDHFIHYNQLIKEISKKSGEKDLDKIKLTINNDLNLMRALLAGLIQISTYPSPYTSAVTPLPIACPFVRYQLASKSRFVTNRRHQPVYLDPLGVALIPYLDGKHDLKLLESILVKEIKEGKLKLLDKDKKEIQNDAEIKKLANTFCLRALAIFAKQALLIPSR